MSPINAFTERKNDTSGAACVRLRPSVAQRHSNNIPGRVSLPLVRERASLAVSSRRMGLAQPQLLNARSDFRRQARSNLTRVRFHLKSFSSSRSSSAERKARKVFHDGEKASHNSGQFSQERSHV